jgi:hypothetical protein
MSGSIPKENGTMADDALEELGALKTALEALSPLDADARRRAIAWLGSALEVGGQQVQGPHTGLNSGAPTESNLGSPKQFLAQKAPRSDIERVTVLAYYLAHARGKAHFKTAELSTLNTEAAGPRLSNASYAASNAQKKKGYLAAAPGGAKQITARGEALVEALPDYEAAEAAVMAMPGSPRRTPPRRARS